MVCWYTLRSCHNMLNSAHEKLSIYEKRWLGWPRSMTSQSNDGRIPVETSLRKPRWRDFISHPHEGQEMVDKSNRSTVLKPQYCQIMDQEFQLHLAKEAHAEGSHFVAAVPWRNKEAERIKKIEKKNRNSPNMTRTAKSSGPGIDIPDCSWTSHSALIPPGPTKPPSCKQARDFIPQPRRTKWSSPYFKYIPKRRIEITINQRLNPVHRHRFPEPQQSV